MTCDLPFTRSHGETENRREFLGLANGGDQRRPAVACGGNRRARASAGGTGLTSNWTRSKGGPLTLPQPYVMAEPGAHRHFRSGRRQSSCAGGFSSFGETSKIPSEQPQLFAACGPRLASLTSLANGTELISTPGRRRHPRGSAGDGEGQAALDSVEELAPRARGDQQSSGSSTSSTTTCSLIKAT